MADTILKIFELRNKTLDELAATNTKTANALAVLATATGATPSNVANTVGLELQEFLELCPAVVDNQTSAMSGATSKLTNAEITQLAIEALKDFVNETQAIHSMWITGAADIARSASGEPSDEPNALALALMKYLTRCRRDYKDPQNTDRVIAEALGLTRGE